MAVVVTDLRTTRDKADATTNWVGSVSPSLFTSAPDPVEATGHLGQVISTAFGYLVHAPGGSINLTNTIVYVWVLPGPAMAALASNGFGIVLSDGTNIIQFNLGGSDVAAFRHNSGVPAYQCLALDTGNLPASTRAHAGTVGGLNLSAITGIGSGFTTTLKAVGGVANCFTDAVRYGNGGLRITGGTSGTPGKFDEIAAEDALTSTGKALGICRRLASGLYGLQGSLTFGEATGSNSSWFEETDVTVVFEARNFVTTRNRIVIQDNGAGTTTFKMGVKVGSGSIAVGSNGCSLIAPTGVGAEFDAATDTDVTDVFIYGTTFTGFTNGIKLRSVHEAIGCIFAASGTIEGAATMVNSSVVGSTAARAMLWNVNVDTAGRLDGVAFTSGGTGHALELGASCPSNITLSDVLFTGYGADGTTNASIYNNSGKAITINISGGTTPTVRNGTGASTTINNSVTLTIAANVSLVGAEIRIYDLDASGNDLGTELAGTETSASATFPFSGSAGNEVWVQIMLTGYEEFGQEVTVPASNGTFNALLRLDPNI